MAAINITGSDTSSGELELSDHGRTEALRNEVITWHIQGNNSSVVSIIAITPKEGFPNVFASGPCQLGASGNWQGRIRNDLQAPTGADYIDEDYNIVWTDSAGHEYIHDPTIRVNI